jgi:hypothetical protein
MGSLRDRQEEEKAGERHRKGGRSPRATRQRGVIDDQARIEGKRGQGAPHGRTGAPGGNEATAVGSDNRVVRTLPGERPLPKPASARKVEGTLALEDVHSDLARNRVAPLRSKRHREREAKRQDEAQQREASSTF